MRLIQLFAEVAFKNSKKVAFITEQNQLSYEDILQLTHVCDIELRSRGIRENSTIVLCSSRPEFYVVFMLLASFRSLNVIFTSPKTIANADMEFDYLITTERSEDIPSEKTILIEPEWFAALGTYPLPDYTRLSGEGGSFTHTSSGSTGKPKFIRAKESQYVDRIMTQIKRPNAPTADTRYISTLSISMSWALGAYIKVLLAGGTVLSLKDHRDRPLQYIDLYGINHLMATPVAIMQIIGVENPAQYLKSIKFVQIGGAYTSNELLSRFMEVYDGRVGVGYGTTEIGGICNAVHERGTELPKGYIGEFYRHDLEITFFDDDMNKLPDASEGIIGFRQLNPGNAKEILTENPDDLNSGNVSDYYFPGDVMRLDGNSLFITGRVKNIINIGGNKYSLEIMQSVLEAAFPGVLLSCIAAPDEIGLETLHIFYAASNELSIGVANSALGEKFGNMKVSKLRRLEEMPITDSGKIDMEILRKMVA